MKSDNYNKVYEHLVEDEDDIVGQLAYCLYKQNKQKFILSFAKQYSRRPSDEELNTYVECSEMPRLQQYEEQATKILSETLLQAVSEREDELNIEFEKKLKTFVYGYKPDGFIERNFFNHSSGAISGLLGNILTTVALVVFLYAVSPSDNKQEFIVSASKNLIAALATAFNVDLATIKNK